MLSGSRPQLFKDDIMYLLTMDKLWKKRKAPTPLDWQQLENGGMSGMKPRGSTLVRNRFIRQLHRLLTSKKMAAMCALTLQLLKISNYLSDVRY